MQVRNDYESGVRSLLKHIRETRWGLAFRLARSLKLQLPISAKVRDALSRFEEQAYEWAERAFHKGDIVGAKGVATALLAFKGRYAPRAGRLLARMHYPRIDQNIVKRKVPYAPKKRRSRRVDRPAQQTKSRGAKYIDFNRPPQESGGEFALPGQGTTEEPIADDKRLEGNAETKAGSSEPVIELVERIPHMELQPESTDDATYRVIVYVDQNQADPNSVVEPVRVPLPMNIRQFDVDVSLAASSHFKVINPDAGVLTITKEESESSKAVFRLRLVDPSIEGDMLVVAHFLHNRRPCGKITRFLQFDQAQQLLSWKMAPPKTQSDDSPTEIALPRDKHQSNVTVELNAVPSDILIEIKKPTCKKAKSNEGPSFTMMCRTPVGKWAGDWTPGKETKDLVKEYMKNFISNKGEAKIASLIGAGMDFWETVPLKARNLLLRAFKTGKIRTISVISEEPYIPWELMVPKQGRSTRLPLGVEFSIGRWITGDSTAPKQFMPLETAFVVAPSDPSLKFSSDEVAFLARMFDALQLKPVTFAKLNEQLMPGGRHLIHFICHGKTAKLQTLNLDPPDTLDCSQVRALKGFRNAFEVSPLAFLNACQVGSQIRTLVGLGGFANSFIDLGAAGVIAPLWSVEHDVAFEVCKIIYSRISGGATIGEAMRDVRKLAYDQSCQSPRDSYAAYCFYGDPLARAGTKKHAVQ